MPVDSRRSIHRFLLRNTLAFAACFHCSLPRRLLATTKVTCAPPPHRRRRRPCRRYRLRVCHPVRLHHSRLYHLLLRLLQHRCPLRLRIRLLWRTCGNTKIARRMTERERDRGSRGRGSMTRLVLSLPPRFQHTLRLVWSIPATWWMLI